MSEIKQIMNEGPIPKHVLEKQLLEKEKEKEREKQRERERDERKEKEERKEKDLVEVKVNENNVLKIKYNINVARDVSPSNVRVFGNPTPKDINAANKADFNPFLKKKKDQVSVEPDAFDFEQFKRKENPENKRVIGSGFPDIKPYPYTPQGANNGVNNIRREISNITPSNDPSKANVVNPFLGGIKSDLRSKSPCAVEDKRVFNFKPAEKINYEKPIADKPAIEKPLSDRHIVERPQADKFVLDRIHPEKQADFGAGGPISCRNERIEGFKIERSEIKIDKSPRNMPIIQESKLRKRQIKEDENLASVISVSKDNNSNNNNPPEKKETPAPIIMTPSPIISTPSNNQLQQQKQEPEKDEAITKIFEENRKKKELERAKLAKLKEEREKEKQSNLLADLQRKEKEFEREDLRIKMKQDIEFKRVPIKMFFSRG